MVHKFTEYIRQYRIINPSEHIIVAVSGGADSVCLFLLLLELQKYIDFSLEVVHVEHGIRGEESYQDAEFTRKLCKKYGVACRVISVDVPSYAESKGLGIEEAARILRYEALVGVADETKLQENEIRAKIALAHHMDDNAETVLFQMIRGSGLRGMTGISPIRTENGVTYIRPLLGISREEIEGYLEEVGQDYRTDSSNLDTEYDRNKIRHKILPELKLINDQALLHINNTIRQLSEVEDYISLQVEEAEKLCFIPSEKTPASISDEYKNTYKELVVDSTLLLGLHPAIRSQVALDAISRVAGRRKDITSAHVAALVDLCQLASGKQISLPYGVRAVKEYDKITLFGGCPDKLLLEEDKEQEILVSREFLRELKDSGREHVISLGNSGEKLIISWKKYNRNYDQIPKKTYTKWIDYDKINEGFLVRKRRAGDYFVTDTSGHRKKLKQYFINVKIPVSRRDDIWLIAKDDEIVDIIGDRLSEAYKVLEGTQEILEIRYERCVEAKNGL